MRKRTILAIPAVAVVALIGFSSCGDSTSTTTTGPASAPTSAAGEIEPTNLAPGDEIEINSVGVTAGKLTPGDSTLGKTLCTTVAYRNDSTSARANYSSIDWQLQDPQGALTRTGFVGTTEPLQTGELAPGGKVSGPVCFRDPGTSGEYRIVFDPMFGDRAEWVSTR
jgi:hypothetical protein